MTANRLRLPPTVGAYALINVVFIIVVLAVSTSLWQYHAGRGAVAAVVLFLWLAAIVVWRRRWAWAVMVLLVTFNVLSPVWGGWGDVDAYAVQVVSLCLLLSPGMRRWVHVGKPAQQQLS